MKTLKKRTLIIMIAVLIMTMPMAVCAASRTLSADYASGKATLSCSFHWKKLNNDTATATTEITKLDPDSPTKYRVAVRLEEWETSKKCTRFQYQSGDNSVSLSTSVEDVFQFASRHSIDNENNTKELEVTSFYYAE